MVGTITLHVTTPQTRAHTDDNRSKLKWRQIDKDLSIPTNESGMRIVIMLLITVVRRPMSSLFFACRIVDYFVAAISTSLLLPVTCCDYYEDQLFWLT
jgi:hypothetical protein